jgi:hypothetical protein
VTIGLDTCSIARKPELFNYSKREFPK